MSKITESLIRACISSFKASRLDLLVGFIARLKSCMLDKKCFNFKAPRDTHSWPSMKASLDIERKESSLTRKDGLVTSLLSTSTRLSLIKAAACDRVQSCLLASRESNLKSSALDSVDFLQK